MPTPLIDSVVCDAEALLPNVSEPDTVPLLCGVKTTLNDWLWPAGMVNGKETPFRANWELLLLAEDTVTLAPTALMVMGSVPVCPTVTLPKLSGAGATTNWPAVIPVPESGTISVGLATSKVPPTVPAVCGVKMTLNVALCPTAKVNGRLGPLTENAPSVVVIPETDTGKLRSFVSVMGTVALCPRATLPNDAAEGLAVSLSLYTPEPSTRSEKAGAETFENMTDPLARPSAVGVKLTLRSKLCPGAKDIGRLNWAAVKSELVTFMDETVMVAAPLFVRVTSKVSV